VTPAKAKSQAAAPTASSNAPPVSESNIKTLPYQFIITLVKGAGDKVGVDVDWSDLDKLKVVKVKDGLMAKWNQDNPDMCVMPGDYIIDINGIRGDARDILDVVKEDSRLVLVISRLHPELRNFEKV